MAINIDNSQRALQIPAILRLAFRPLFLGGTLFSIFAIGWWIYFWLDPFSWQPHGGPIWWHGHEMIFGFGVAIVTGFLLTAVQSWTGVIGLRGKPLAALALTWLAGRILVAFKLGLAGWVIAAIDVSFLMGAAVAMAYPIIKVKQWQNLMFIPILTLLAITNATSHWAILNNQYLLAIQCLHGAVLLFVLTIAILGGRVIPAFTSNTTNQPRAMPIKWLEITAIVSILAMFVIALIGFNQVSTEVLFLVSLIAAIANGLRFSRWGIQHTMRIPLLWSLHLAFAFIPIGFFLLALYSIELMGNSSAALHSFTVGSIGGMILSMISRVSLGHTGRNLQIHPLIAVSYSFILLAALSRIILPGWFPALSYWGIAVSGIFWVLGYGLFVYFYGPMLLTRRIDGQPG